MHNKNFIEGMLIQARKMHKECAWYNFIKKAYIKGWILACETILENEE